MSTPALVRRFGVVVSTTAIAVAALSGVAAAAPGDHGNGSANSHTTVADSAASSTTAPGNSGAAHDKAGKNDSHSTAGTAGTSGDPTKPQPLSNADQNSGGANGQCTSGVYCSTRNGDPSANGNGGGNATGKPCAGCVGKADNKNPKGQMPGGSDNNAGYECDRNHGIGRGNPAHTGCTSSPTSVTTCPSGQVMVAGTCTTPDTTTETCPAGMVLLSGECSTPNSTCPAGEEMVGLACVLGVSDSRNPGAGSTADVPPTVLGEQFVRTPAVAAAAAALPFTGAPTGELVLLAAAALAAGGALATAGRRKKA